MKYSLETGVFTSLSEKSLWDVEGVRTNGQHPQLADHILIDVKITHLGPEYTLYHPRTSEDNGHFDLKVRTITGGTFMFQRYSEFKEVALEDLLPGGHSHYLFPVDPGTLIDLMVKLEQYLSEAVSYEPTFAAWLFKCASAREELAV